MTKKDQRRIVGEMIKNLRADMAERLPRVPAEWDGIELRELFADRADTFRHRRTFINDEAGRRAWARRFRAYSAECYNRNL
jgi:hypothetical protein